MHKSLIVLVPLLLAACTPESAPQGQQLFNAYCVQCHGVSAQGDGVLAEDLDQPPADLTALALANDGVMPRDHVMQLVHGYPGKFQTTTMPEFGPLLRGPTRQIRTQDGMLVETPIALIALVDYLETLQQR